MGSVSQFPIRVIYGTHAPCVSRRSPPHHPSLAGTGGVLGGYLVGAGRYAEAEPVLRETMRLATGCVPARPDLWETARKNLAACLRALDRDQEGAAIEAEPPSRITEPSSPSADEGPE